MTDMRTEKHIMEFSESDARKINPEGVYRRMLECHSCPLFEGDIKRIANAFGLGYGSMLAFIKQHGLDGRLEDEIMKKVDYERVMALYNSGKTDAQITKELDISFATVHMWRQRHGFEKNEPVAADKSILLVGDEKKSRRPTSDEIAAAILDRKQAEDQIVKKANPALAEITADGVARNKKKRDSLKIDFDKKLPKLARPAKAKVVKPKPAAPEIASSVLIPSEEITAGAINQTMGARPTDLFVEMQQMVEAYQDDIDDLLHGWYQQLSRQIFDHAMNLAKELSEQNEDKRDNIDDLMHEWYDDYRQWIGFIESSNNVRDSQFDEIKRLKLERMLLIAMLVGAGMTDIDGRLKRLIEK